MAHDEGENADGVSVSMEVTGPYDDVISKLKSSTTERDAIGPLMGDVQLLLETVERMGGGTRSAIADQLPPEMTADFDAEAVVETCQVLERYDLVVLEGNTWKPGPRLGE
ncbi:hypothetical protein [Haloarcula amylovorans]|uniref:hypothetical protein n=1 Tax=Haloarcula amylovorans TaxID=2562280 RepID=UPI00107664FD|nr:hypothetical protein [Halomicroarcula amylolytica]